MGSGMDYRDRRDPEEMAKLFDGRPEPIDWAENEARVVACDALSFSDLEFSIRRFGEQLTGKRWKSENARAHLAWCISCALAGQIRMIRSDIMKSLGDSIESLAKKGAKKALMDPAELGVLVRKAAAKFDDRGMSHEASICRDAATVIEEDL